MTAKLILSFNERPVGEFPLTKETITVGRKLDNDIQVNDLAVSGHHTRVITILNNSFLEDLGSTNGTFVNGKFTKKHALQNGDVIKLGKHHLKYLNEDAPQYDEFDKTMVIRPSAPPAGNGDGNAAPTPYSFLGKSDNNKTAGKGALKVLSGPNKHKELKLTKALTTIGKPGVQVAAITRRPTGFFLISVVGGSGSNPAPVVNGKPIGAQAHKLNPNDLIEVAGVRMEFFAP